MANLIRFCERLFLVLLCLGVIVRIAPAVPHRPQLILFLLNEFAAVLLILVQRRGVWATTPYALTIGFIGTAAGLSIFASGHQLVPNIFSTILVFGGTAISLVAKVFLGRSFGLIAANRGVKRGGLYRIVRHPMYLGYIVNQMGFLLVFFSAWNVVVYAISWTAFWLRAVEEEKFLARDPAYRQYAQAVRYRLLPGIV